MAGILKIAGLAPLAGALVTIFLDDSVFRQSFATGHKTFLGLLMAGVMVRASSGLPGKRTILSTGSHKR